MCFLTCYCALFWCISALSFPSTGHEAVYRKSLQDVARMLKDKHGDNYQVSYRWISCKDKRNCIWRAYVHIHKYVYTCTYIIIRTNINIHTHIHIQLYIHTLIYTFICKYIHTHTYSHTYIYNYTYVYINKHTHIHKYTYT